MRLDVLRLAGLRLRDWPDSDIAIAIACFRFFTLRPEPLFNERCLYSCITLWTFRF
ncbi:MAG: hypothetical protein JO162_06505 [Alphaproteobacteria bacterium]|nr:hypothetical protein [Alphaproteobacteria bacterium]